MRRGRYLLRWVEHAAEVGGAHDGADLEPLGAGDGRVGHGAARVLVQLHAHAQRGALVGRPVEGALRGAHVVGEVVAGGRRAVGVDELVAADAALDRGWEQLAEERVDHEPDPGAEPVVVRIDERGVVARAEQVLEREAVHGAEVREELGVVEVVGGVEEEAEALVGDGGNAGHGEEVLGDIANRGGDAGSEGHRERVVVGCVDVGGGDRGPSGRERHREQAAGMAVHEVDERDDPAVAHPGGGEDGVEAVHGGDGVGGGLRGGENGVFGAEAADVEPCAAGVELVGGAELPERLEDSVGDVVALEHDLVARGPRQDGVPGAGAGVHEDGEEVGVGDGLVPRDLFGNPAARGVRGG